MTQQSHSSDTSLVPGPSTAPRHESQPVHAAERSQLNTQPGGVGILTVPVDEVGPHLKRWLFDSGIKGRWLAQQLGIYDEQISGVLTGKKGLPQRCWAELERITGIRVDSKAQAQRAYKFPRAVTTTAAEETLVEVIRLLCPSADSNGTMDVCTGLMRANAGAKNTARAIVALLGLEAGK